MPSTVLDLLESIPIKLTDSVRWNESVQSNKSGVYIVSLSKDPGKNCGALNSAPIEIKTVEKWSRVCGLELDKDPNSSAKVIAQRLSEFWLPDESILYIGQTSRPLSSRLSEYYKHKLGDSKPHRGGHWLKALSNLSSVFVHYAETQVPEKVEQCLIEAFVNGVSSSNKNILRDKTHPFPFANLELKVSECHQKRKIRKRHGIGNQTKKVSSKLEMMANEI